MVLGGGEGKCVAAVDEGEEARLLADQAFLDHDLRACSAERAREAGLDGGGGSLARLGDGDALAGGEAVGLDHDGQRLALEVGQRRCLSLKRP